MTKTELAEGDAGDNPLTLLYTMRDRVRAGMTDERCHARDLVSLVTRLQDIARDIETLTEKLKLEDKADADLDATAERLDLLTDARKLVLEAMDNEDCHPRDLAALTRRLQDVSREINEINERRKRGARGNVNGSSDDDGSGEPAWDSSL